MKNLSWFDKNLFKLGSIQSSQWKGARTSCTDSDFYRKNGVGTRKARAGKKVGKLLQGYFPFWDIGGPPGGLPDWRFLVEWVKVLFLGRAKTIINSWFGDRSYSISNFIFRPGPLFLTTRMVEIAHFDCSCLSTRASMNQESLWGSGIPDFCQRKPHHQVILTSIYRFTRTFKALTWWELRGFSKSSRVHCYEIKYTT